MRKHTLFVGVFRKGQCLFPIIEGIRDYKTAAFVCCLIEALHLPIQDGDYIACDYIR